MINYTNMIMCSDCKRHIITQESIEIVKIVCFSIVLIVFLICLTILIAMYLKKKNGIKLNLIDLLKNDEKVKELIKCTANNK